MTWIAPVPRSGVLGRRVRERRIVRSEYAVAREIDRAHAHGVLVAVPQPRQRFRFRREQRLQLELRRRIVRRRTDDRLFAGIGKDRLSDARRRETLAANADVSTEHHEPGDQATLLRTREEILASRGEPIDDLLAEHVRLVADLDQQQQSSVIAMRGLVAFLGGRYQEAAAAFRRSVELNATNAPLDYPKAARAYLGAVDAAEVRP